MPLTPPLPPVLSPRLSTRRQTNKQTKQTNKIKPPGGTPPGRRQLATLYRFFGGLVLPSTLAGTASGPGADTHTHIMNRAVRRLLTWRPSLAQRYRSASGRWRSARCSRRGRSMSCSSSSRQTGRPLRRHVASASCAAQVTRIRNRKPQLMPTLELLGWHRPRPMRRIRVATRGSGAVLNAALSDMQPGGW